MRLFSAITSITFFALPVFEAADFVFPALDDLRIFSWYFHLPKIMAAA